MTTTSPQRATGVSRAETRGESRGEITPQPVTFERLDGERLTFRSVAEFSAWWSAQQRREVEAEEIASRV